MLYYYDYAYINSGTGKTNVWLKKKDQEWGCLEVGCAGGGLGRV